MAETAAHLVNRPHPGSPLIRKPASPPPTSLHGCWRLQGKAEPSQESAAGQEGQLPAARAPRLPCHTASSFLSRSYQVLSRSYQAPRTLGSGIHASVTLRFGSSLWVLLPSATYRQPLLHAPPSAPDTPLQEALSTRPEPSPKASALESPFLGLPRWSSS